MGDRPLGFSGLMYIRKSNVLDVVMWQNSTELGKTHYSGNNKRGIGTFDIDTKAATGSFYSRGIRI